MRTADDIINDNTDITIEAIEDAAAGTGWEPAKTQAKPLIDTQAKTQPETRTETQPETVDAAAMMAARERRAARQACLLAQGGTLISFTMNVPGPVKRSPLWERGFAEGCRLLEARLKREPWPVRQRRRFSEITGYEAFWLLEADAPAVKAAAVAVEDSCPIGRLFDIDVLAAPGAPLSRSSLGLAPRTCLLCGRPAHECGRSRRHSQAELLDRINGLLRDYFREREADRAAAFSCRAMLTEVSVTPKPGLVDRHDAGSHLDMDFYTFIDSAAALTPWFRRFFLLGTELAQLTPEDAFDRLRFPGMLAEEDMYAATGGVNTHKGMIFSLALLTAAWGRLWGREQGIDAHALLTEAAAMAGSRLRQELDGAETTADTAGLRLKALSGAGGVRAEAAAGYPSVRLVGLPRLRAYLAQGLTADRAGGLTLLALMAAAEDSNVFSRCGRAAQLELTARMRELSDRTPPPTAEELYHLNEDFRRRRLSPGGAADLLALTFFLYYADGETERQP